MSERTLTTSQIRWIESQPGHWHGRAQTRRDAAKLLRANNDAPSADRCDKVATEYEAKAGEALAAITMHA